MAEENPYATPHAAPADLTNQPVNRRFILGRWEKMRLRYNLIMLIAGACVLIMMGNILPISFLLFGAVLVGIIANVCYFLGPVSESILCSLLKSTELPTYRIFAFTLGAVGSLVFFALLSFSYRPFYYF